MSARSAVDAARSNAPEGPVDLAVAVGLGVATWAVLLLAVGVVVRLRLDSLLSLVSLLAVGVMAWPVVAVAPWRPGGPTRVRRWARRRRPALVATAGLLLLVASPVAPAALEPVLSVLRLPFRAAAGFLFGPSLVYERAVTPAFGRGLFVVGQWYVAAIAMYVVAGLLVHAGRTVRGGSGA